MYCKTNIACYSRRYRDLCTILFLGCFLTFLCMAAVNIIFAEYVSNWS